MQIADLTCFGSTDAGSFTGLPGNREDCGIVEYTSETVKPFSLRKCSPLPRDLLGGALLHGAQVQMPPTAQTFKQAPKAEQVQPGQLPLEI
jgi:hypothetical protein